MQHSINLPYNCNIGTNFDLSLFYARKTLIKALLSKIFFKIFMKTEISFFASVYEIVKKIPRGRVCTYGAIADYLDTGSARMVGWAMNHSHAEDDKVPAHRVVNRKGELTGRHHFASPTMMQEMLESEGVVIENHCVRDFGKLFWRPSEARLG